MEDYSLTDDLLVGQCLAGDKSSWEVLLRRYERLIYHTALREGATPDEAADVFQSVCLIWLEELGRIRDTRRLGAWLVTTTRRECWARWKKDHTVEGDAMTLLEDRAGEESSPEALSSQAEDALLLQAGLKELADPCRTLLHLLYFEPKHPSYSVIARRLDIPVNSLGPTRARCLQKLKDILGKKGW